MDQDQIDAFLQPKYTDESSDEELEKGLTHETLAFVIKTIKQMDKPFTIQELTKEAKLSHVSIRKYVSYLEKKEQLKSENIYLKVGRPYKVYVWG